MRYTTGKLSWLMLPLFCCGLSGCTNLTPFEWTYTPGQGWSGPHYHDDVNVDASEIEHSTKYYEQRGEDPKTAQRNAYDDFYQANGRFPSP
jgi:hypothetical protein